MSGTGGPLASWTCICCRCYRFRWTRCLCSTKHLRSHRWRCGKEALVVERLLCSCSGRAYDAVNHAVRDCEGAVLAEKASAMLARFSRVERTVGPCYENRSTEMEASNRQLEDYAYSTVHCHLRPFHLLSDSVLPSEATSSFGGNEA